MHSMRYLARFSAKMAELNKVKAMAKKITPKTEMVAKDDAPIATPYLAPITVEDYKRLQLSPLHFDGCLHMSPYAMATLERAQLALVNAAQALALNKIGQEKLKMEEVRLSLISKQMAEELQLTRNMLQKTYKIFFDVVTYDSVTGKLLVDGKPVERE